MNEQTPESEFNYRESAVTKLVLERVTSWEELNADNELIGDKVFQKRLLDCIGELHTPETEDSDKKPGFFYETKELVEDNVSTGVMLKKLTWIPTAGPMSREELFQRDKEQTLLCLEHFGPRFIPHTEFFARANADGSTDYFIAQDKVDGLQYKNYKEEVDHKSGDVVEFPPGITTEAIVFCQRYMEFFKQTGNVLDLDLMIDTEDERLWLFDPSNFRQPYENIPDQLKSFTKLLRIREEIPESDYEDLLSSN